MRKFLMSNLSSIQGNQYSPQGLQTHRNKQSNTNFNIKLASKVSLLVLAGLFFMQNVTMACLSSKFYNSVCDSQCEKKHTLEDAIKRCVQVCRCFQNALSSVQSNANCIHS